MSTIGAGAAVAVSEHEAHRARTQRQAGGVGVVVGDVARISAVALVRLALALSVTTSGVPALPPVKLPMTRATFP